MQIRLEGREVLREGDGLLGAVHESGEAGRNVHGRADDTFDRIFELGGMGGFAEEAHFPGAEALLQRAVAACAVGIQQIAGAGETVLDGLSNLIIRVGRSRNVFPYRLHVMAVQIPDAGEVARIADVHCVGDGADGRTRTVLARAEELVEHAVRIVRGNEALDGKPHPMPEQRRADVAEIAAGDVTLIFILFFLNFNTILRLTGVSINLIINSSLFSSNHWPYETVLNGNVPKTVSLSFRLPSNPISIVLISSPSLQFKTRLVSVNLRLRSSILFLECCGIVPLSTIGIMETGWLKASPIL